MLCTVLSEVTNQATSVLMYLQPIAEHYAFRPSRISRETCAFSVNSAKILSHFIFTKFSKTVASGCQILWLKCTKFDFGRGFSQDLTGSLQHLLPPSQKPNPLLSDLRISNFPSPAISGSDTAMATGMSEFSLGVNAFRGMTANSCIFVLFITDIG